LLKYSLSLALCSLMLMNCGGAMKKRNSLRERLADGKVSVDEIYKRAGELMAERKYQDARQWYRVIEANAPNSPFYADTKMKIADSYFFDKMATYVEASVEYKSFLTHFPSHGLADYAMYQYAMCFFTEIESADRDQTSTWTSYTEFNNLIDKYPASIYAQKAREKIALCQLRLADHDFIVGYYYFRRGQGFEQSAEGRLKQVLNNYEGQYDEVKTYFYLAETLWRRQKYREALFYYNYLNENHEDSEYQAFVIDKLARWQRIEADGEDPGELHDETEADSLSGQ